MALHKIRVRQSDSASQDLMAQTWKKVGDGAPDVLVAQQYLNVPTDLSEFYAGEDQYIVIRQRD